LPTCATKKRIALAAGRRIIAINLPVVGEAVCRTETQMRKVLIILLVLVVIVIAWIYLFTGTPPWGPKLKLKDTAVTSIELSWFGTNRTITASDQGAKVIQTMCKARQHHVATTPFLGNLTLFYADGTTNMFYLLPADRTAGLEISGKSGGYAISMGEMLRTFESVGLLTKN
jgi:hypothetical protein